MARRKITISKLFFVNDKEQIIAHLASFDWIFEPGDVRVVSGNAVLAVRQIGGGNHEGDAVVVLKPFVSWNIAVESIGRMQAGAEDILIER